MSVDERGWNELTLVGRLRATLRPRGTSPVVGLSLEHRMFSETFINQCIDELERIGTIRAALGDTPNCLERLAFALLCDSAGIPTENQKQRN